MKKPLAGKRGFEALGRRAGAYGPTLCTKPPHMEEWPEWARVAYMRGWINQAFPNFKQWTTP